MDVIFVILIIATCLGILNFTFGKQLCALDAGGGDNYRVSTLDGLRGILAISVIFYHANISLKFHQVGIWETSQVIFLRLLGNGAVGMFFMITAYLFWGKVNSAKHDWLGLYRSRLARIVPLYMFSVICAFALAIVFSGGVQGSMGALVLSFLKWSCFGFIDLPDINGVSKSFSLVAGVYWTLKYEWLFYCSLPVLALLTGRRKFLLAALFILSFLVQIYEGGVTKSYTMGHVSNFFAMGIFAYEFKAKRIKDSTASWIGIVFLMAYFLFFETAYSLPAAICLGVAFWAVVSGASFFGILRSAGARSAGVISYSVYLLHGLVLFSTWKVGPAVIYGSGGYWVTVFFVVLFVIAICTMTYRYIERPFIVLARRRVQRDA